MVSHKECPTPQPENDDDVRVSIDENGKVSGSVYHTDPGGLHGKINPWIVPVDDERTDGGFFANTEERPGYTYVSLDTAKLFGLRECQVCERHRRIAGSLEKVVVYKGMSKAGKVRLTVNEESVLLDVGQGYDWTTKETFTIPSTLASLIGVDTEDEDE